MGMCCLRWLFRIIRMIRNETKERLDLLEQKLQEERTN